ncbi:hypothetical protein MMC28_009131 [Mycoblastus sanguinarius]|nr:hypothetical protein [Mycoblastus sanguinarius]
MNLTAIVAFLLVTAKTVVHSLPASPNVILPQNLTNLDLSLTSGLAEPANLTDHSLFSIENCGVATRDISLLLYSLQSAVLQAYADSVSGVDSVHCFRSMFKSNDAKQAVQLVLDAIYHRNGRYGLLPAPDILTTPRIACVSQETVQIYIDLKLSYDPWQRCLTGSPSQSSIKGFYAEGTVYTFLCPEFDKQRPWPSQNHCPTLHYNQFAGDVNIIYRSYQIYTLIYELVQFYLGRNALDRDSNPPEALNWNDCVRYDTIYSVLNPSNFQIYTALVAQECTDCPDPRFAPFGPQNSLSSNFLPVNLSQPSNTLSTSNSRQTQVTAVGPDVSRPPAGILMFTNDTVSNAGVA